MTTAPPSATYGVHSEVGKLRKVLVCSPGLAHERLTPSNCDDLLFDDVLWVQNARRDHFDFMDKMRDRDVEVVELHDVLTETMGNPEAKAWLLDRKIVANEVGLGLVDDTRGFLESLQPRRLAELLIGGMSTRDLPKELQSGYRALARESSGVTEYLMPPLPNTLYTRDTTCWIYGGVTLNPLFWPARHDETLLMKAIYEFHPDFVGSTVWWGDPEQVVGPGHNRGRRRAGPRQWCRHHRDERTHLAAGHHPGRGQVVRRRRRREGDRRGNAEAAGGHAPGHRLHLRRPRCRDDLSRHRRRHADVHAAPQRRRRRVWRSIEADKPFVEVVPPGSDWPSCGWWRPAAPNTTQNGSSGTAATTSSPSNRVWCSPTTATPTPIRCCARRVSR